MKSCSSISAWTSWVLMKRRMWFFPSAVVSFLASSYSETCSLESSHQSVCCGKPQTHPRHLLGGSASAARLPMVCVQKQSNFFKNKNGAVSAFISQDPQTLLPIPCSTVLPLLCSGAAPPSRQPPIFLPFPHALAVATTLPWPYPLSLSFRWKLVQNQL